MIYPATDKLSFIATPAHSPNSISSATSTSSSLNNGAYQSFVMGSLTSLSSMLTPTSSTASPTATSVCPASNGTTFTSGGSKPYQVICNVDFPADIFPFQMVQSYNECVSACDAYNTKVGSNRCVAALFVPQRLHDEDDCYLKSSLDHPTTASVSIQGALLVTSASSSTTGSTSTSSSTSTSTGSVLSSESQMSHSKVASSTSSSSSTAVSSTLLMFLNQESLTVQAITLSCRKFPPRTCTDRAKTSPQSNTWRLHTLKRF